MDQELTLRKERGRIDTDFELSDRVTSTLTDGIQEEISTLKTGVCRKAVGKEVIKST